MGQTRKIDFFVGVFISVILNSTKSVPALFDETDTVKKVEFQTNKGYFNVYVKYSTKRNESIYNKKSKKKQYYTYIMFSEIEFEKLANFKKNGYQNYVVFVCTKNEALTDPWIVVLDYEKAIKCLRNTLPDGKRRIKITRFGNGQKYICKGVGFKEDEYESCSTDYTSYFE